MNLFSTVGCAALMMLSGIGREAVVHWHFSGERISTTKCRIRAVATMERGWQICFSDSNESHKKYFGNRAELTQIIDIDPGLCENVRGDIRYELCDDAGNKHVQQTSFEIEIPQP